MLLKIRSGGAMSAGRLWMLNGLTLSYKHTWNTFRKGRIVSEDEKGKVQIRRVFGRIQMIYESKKTFANTVLRSYIENYQVHMILNQIHGQFESDI